MSDDENQLVAQVQKDNEHFKGLLDLIPPAAYFSQEEKDEIWGNEVDSEDEEDFTAAKKKKKFKKHGGSSLSNLTVTQIAEMRQRGETVGKKKKQQGDSDDDDDDEDDSGIAAKHQGKKLSRSSKGKKKSKGKELQRRQARLEELREKLHKKLEDMKAKKVAGKGGSTQEQKRLRRQEKRLNAKLKHKNSSANANHKEQRAAQQHIAHGLRSPPQNNILNDNGVPVRSKFDFSTISFGREKARSDLHGRDYKRLLEKVERRNQKVALLKEKDEAKGQQLESKIQWQGVLARAQGEKVKDDVGLLKKAVKKKDKVREKKQQKWGDRVKTVEDKQKRRQDRRQANIDKRKQDNKDLKRKKMIKKGRIIPGF